MQFSPASCYILFLRSEYSFQPSVLNNHHIYYSHNVKDDYYDTLIKLHQPKIKNNVQSYKQNKSLHTLNTSNEKSGFKHLTLYA
jgi:hypothetical protein